VRVIIGFLSKRLYLATVLLYNCLKALKFRDGGGSKHGYIRFSWAGVDIRGIDLDLWRPSEEKKKKVAGLIVTLPNQAAEPAVVMLKKTRIKGLPLLQPRLSKLSNTMFSRQKDEIM
jgi:hypothetical protein